MNILAKMKETAVSVLPVMAIVLFLGFTFVPLDKFLLARFVVGGLFLIIGLTIFLLGVDLGIQPMGQRCGAELTKKRSLFLLLGVALIIGFIVPIGKLGKGASGRLGLEEHSLGARCIESLVADLIFTPVMTVAMVSFAYMMAKKHDEAMPYVPALLRSLAIGLVLGFMLAFVLTPVYLKIAMKGAGPDREGSSE